MNASGNRGYRSRIPRIMFAYACVTTATALIWFAWALLSGGEHTLPNNAGPFATTMFAIYAAPCVVPLSPPRGEQWAPLLGINPGRIAAARFSLAASFVNIWLWPWLSRVLSASALFTLVLPAWLCSARL